MNPVSRWPEIARRKSGTPLRYFGFPAETTGALDSGSTCATSILHARSRTRADCAAAVGDRRVPDHRDPDGAGVEALRVRADHIALDASVPAFEDLSEPVDEEVVADVVPPVSAYVVQVDPAHDGRRLGGRRRLPTGVADHGGRQCLGEPGTVAADPLVCAPGLASDDRGTAGHLERPAQRFLGAPDVMGALYPADPAAHSHLEAPRLSRPQERTEPPASHPARLPRSAVRSVLCLGLGLAPEAPAGRPAHA